ncbi:MAG: phospholipase [Bacteroidota bacterium]
MTKHTLTIPRTARYYTLPPPDEGPVREVWVVCHGYGQLASHFLRHFQAIVAPGRLIVAPGRLIVAPEGLSRFYLDGADGQGNHGTYQRIAASWMTRDDRDAEIADQVAYLDAVFAEVCARHDVDPKAARLVGFGFSQGAATIGRWLDRSPLLAERSHRAQRFITWGNVPPHDLDWPEARATWLDAADVQIVVGAEDPFLTPEHLAQAQVVLDGIGVAYEVVCFDGGHRLHAETLREVAGAVADGVRS